MFNECGLALAHSRGLPALGYWAFSFSGGQQEFTAQPAPPSHVPAFMSGLTHKMSLAERCYNLAAKLGARLLMYYYHWVVDTALAELCPASPPAAALLANLSGMLINTDNVLDYPRPQPPTFLNVGGLQIQRVGVNYRNHHI